MKLSETCIQRPVFASVLAIMLVLIGIVSWDRVQIREYPNIDEPVVNVTTNYRGASAEIIESQVTKPIEDTVAGIEGVEFVKSTSRAERSQVTVTFRLSRDPESAAADVRDRVARVRGRLPDNVDEPVISKVEADARATVWLALSSPSLSPLEVTDLATRQLKPRLQTLPGSADVQIFGDREYSMRIWLDPGRLAAFRLTPLDVEQALRAQNLELPSGRIESEMREFNVISRTDINDVPGFEAIVIRVVDGYPVQVRDVARVGIAPANERSLVRFNGDPSVGLGLIKQATANPLILAQALREALPELRSLLPDDVTLTVAYDSTIFIDRSIQAVFTTIAEAAALVAIIIFLFLGGLRASLIPLITIPVCLISAFTLIDLFGYSVNTLTLLALVVAIGLVVDDAIVVLENSHRHIEEGLTPMDAAFTAIREVGFAVVAMTMTLAAVFAPMAFQTGRTGRLFTEFALTLAGTVVISGFLALTISPMMCSRLLRHERPARWFELTSDRLLRALSRGYSGLLSAIISLRWVMALVAIGFSGLTWWLWTTLPAELAPQEDRGVFSTVFTAPEGSSVNFTGASGQAIEKVALSTDDVWRILLIVGNPTPTGGLGFIGLNDWNERDRSVFDVVKEFQGKLASVPGVRAFAIAPASLGASIRSRPVNLVVMSPDSFAETARTIEPLLEEFRASGLMTGIETDLTMNKPEFRVLVDRARAADAGVSVDAVGRTLETMLGGRAVTRFKRNAEEFDVIVQLDARDRTTPDVIDQLFVRGTGDAMLPLSALVDVKSDIGARELNHFGQRRSITITANLADGVALGQVVDYLRTVTPRYMKSGYATEFTGPTYEYTQASNTLLITFALALAFVYLVLAAQFESFVDPLTILFAVPLSLAGGLGLLHLTGGTLNVYSQIGLITLVGLITKHGILIVEFANQLRDNGASLRDAVVKASSLRLRPILMTTVATVFGALPLWLATGAGSESRRQIGEVIVGGMTLGTIMTLFVVPGVYVLFARRRSPRVIPPDVPVADIPVPLSPHGAAAQPPVGAALARATPAVRP